MPLSFTSLQSHAVRNKRRVKVIDAYNRIYVLLVQLFNYVELFIKLYKMLHVS